MLTVSTWALPARAKPSTADAVSRIARMSQFPQVGASRVTSAKRAAD